MSKPKKWNRRRPKNARAGCLMCKSWKVNGVHIESDEGEAFNVHRKRIAAKRDIAAYWAGE